MKKKNWTKVFVIIFFVLLGAISVFVGMVSVMGETSDWYSHGELVIKLLGIIIVLYIAMFFHIVIHEGGHFIGGLMSGYRFQSFRIGSLQVMKENGKLKMSRFSIPGTAGQCLMGPPCPYSEDIPYLLYNLSGGIANLATALLAFGIAQMVNMPQLISGYIIIFGVIGVGIGLMNLVPMHTEMVDNDGCNAMSIRKSKTAKRNFWIQLRVVELMGEGVRVREMPDELFLMPDEESMEVGINATIGTLVLNRAIDAMEFQRAWEITEHLLHKASGLLGFHKRMLQIEQIFLCSISEETHMEARNKMTKEIKKILSATKKTLTTLRVTYAYTLLVEKDEQEAQQIIKRFNSIIKTYPYKGEAEGEQMLMEYVKELGCGKR